MFGSTNGILHKFRLLRCTNLLCPKSAELIRSQAVTGRKKCFKKKSRKITRDDFIRAFRACLYKSLTNQNFQTGNKVSVVGLGAVGVTTCMVLLAKNITNNIALYDVDSDLCKAERLDLLHGSLFQKSCQVEQCSDIKATKGSRVVVVTAGARMEPDNSRLHVAAKSAEIIKGIMPKLVEQSPNAVFIIVSNPVDVMTWVARKVTKLPYERCFSTGCHLDSARFRMLLARRLGVSINSVDGFIIGEHGDSSVPMWSSVSIGGVRLQDVLPTIGTENDPLKFSKIHQDVVDAAYKIVSVKGYTNWAVGLSIADVISAIFENSNRIMSLSTNAAGMCGISDEIFLSLPCIVNEWGLSGIIRPYLSDWEKCALKNSADELLRAQRDIKL